MNIRKGLFVGRIAPYGYQKSEENKHKLIYDPYAASIVRQIFEMAAGGKNAPEITSWLNSNGILPPKRYFHSLGLLSEKDNIGHVHWNKSVVYALLKNRMYCGDMVQGRFQTRSYVQKSLPKSEWVVVENTHEGIVSRELFDTVQAKRAPYAKRERSEYPTENIFLRKIFCGHCGFALKRAQSGKKDKGNYILLCDTRRSHAKGDCVPVSINENALKRALLDILGKQAEVFNVGSGLNAGANIGGSVRTSAGADTDSTITNEKTADKEALKKVQGEISKNSHFLKSLYESLVTQDVTQDEYRELKAGYEDKLAALTARKKELRDSILERMIKESAVSKAVSNLHGINEISDLTSDVMDRLVDKIIVCEGKRFEVFFKFNDGIAVEGGVPVGRNRDSKIG